MTLHIGENSSFAQLIDIANNLHLYTESIPDLEFNTIRKNLMRHSDDISSFLSTFPPLFYLKKPFFLAKYNHSVIKCPICKFHFATAAAYEQHLPEQCAIFARKQINPALISYFKTQCTDELREVVEEMETKSEFTFSCPIISCSEGFNCKFTVKSCGQKYQLIAQLIMLKIAE